jgi:hypothetical protein
MAGEIVYYCFSITFVLGMLSWLINLILLRINGKTTYGIAYKVGTTDHRRIVSHLANPGTIAISALLALVLTLNLIYDITRILDFKDQEFAHALLLYGTIFVLAMWVILIPTARKQAKIAGESVKARAKK